MEKIIMSCILSSHLPCALSIKGLSAPIHPSPSSCSFLPLTSILLCKRRTHPHSPIRPRISIPNLSQWQPFLLASVQRSSVRSTSPPIPRQDAIRGVRLQSTLPTPTFTLLKVWSPRDLSKRTHGKTSILIYTFCPPSCRPSAPILTLYAPNGRLHSASAPLLREWVRWW